MKNRSGKIDPDYFNVEGTKVLFVGNEEGSMDVKFNRIAIIAKRYNDLVDKLKEQLKDNTIPTSKEYNLAAALLLITKTGIRIGNESSAEGFMSTYKEKGKEVLAKTYGLTTLKQEHVKIANGIVGFDFTGKKHVENTFVLDKDLSKYLIPIVKSNYDPVFNITESELTRYIKKFTSPYLSSKDFRTFRANVYAFKHAKSLSKPSTKKEWKEKAKLVYEHVAKLLNNTPAVTKSSYIDPALLIEMWGDPNTIETKKQGGVMNIPVFKKGGDISYPGAGTKDACYKKAVKIYGKKSSAYRSGYMSKCRKKKAKGKKGIVLKAEVGLNMWFSRNNGKGWIDCRTGKSCGREKGEKRGHPACRPTKSACKDKGKGSSWGKIAYNKNGGKIAVFAYSHLMNNDNVFPILGRKPKQSEHHLDGFGTKKNSDGETVLTPDNTKTTKGTKFYITNSELTKLTKAMSPYKVKQIGGDSTYSKLITFYKKGGVVKMQIGDKFQPLGLVDLKEKVKKEKQNQKQFNDFQNRYNLNTPSLEQTKNLKDGTIVGKKVAYGGNLYDAQGIEPVYPEEYVSTGVIGKGAAKVATALSRPVTITAAAPVAKRIQQAYNLPVSSVKEVKGAYRFSKPTVYSLTGESFSEGTVIPELSKKMDIPLIKWMMQPDKVKKALKETGEESVLFSTNNPLFLRNSKAIEITGDTGEDLLTKGARMFGGASQVAGESPKAITNFVENAKPSFGGLKQALFGTPTDLSASLIYANKKGGIVGNKFPMYKKGGRIDKDKLPCNKPRTNPTNSRHKKIVKACANGKEKLVKFGHRKYKHNYSEQARKSYCARSAGIKGGEGKLSANYWSRKVLWNC